MKKVKYPVLITDVRKEHEFYEELISAYDEAHEYIRSFRWCSKVYSAFVYLNFGSILCVFLFNIENAQSASDSKIWIIVGDIPSMYLDTNEVKTVKEVLLNYIELASDWIDAILKGKDISDCFPFQGKASKKNALLLEKRIKFIKENMLSSVEDIALSEDSWH